jgi:hypothetical protein
MGELTAWSYGGAAPARVVGSLRDARYFRGHRGRRSVERIGRSPSLVVAFVPPEPPRTPPVAAGAVYRWFPWRVKGLGLYTRPQPGSRPKRARLPPGMLG